MSVVRNVAETAEYLRLSERYVWSLISSGALPHRRIGGRVLTTQEDCDALLEKHRNNGEAA